jgi:hypothetical protein
MNADRADFLQDGFMFTLEKAARFHRETITYLGLGLGA